LGPHFVKSHEQLALSLGCLWSTLGAEVDAAAHRVAKAEGREFVTREAVDHRRALTSTRPLQLLPAVEGYDRWAPIYDHAPNPLLAREERYLAPLLSGLQGKSALDIACGTGRWLEKLLSRGCASGVGVDCSAAMLRVADKKSAISGRLARATCEDLPLATASLDLVICSFALGHFPDLYATVRELKRVTKLGADIFISDLHPGAYQHGWRVGFRDHEASVQIQVTSRSVAEMISAFRSNGFDCLLHSSLWLGEPEKQLFAQAGKLQAFGDACRLPAVIVFHFRRVSSH
jgi:ubiquinone/menaquinone biosynthesis C-methylase UbiE